MSNTPHELAEEFPADLEKMHALKLANPHFAKLMEDYTEVNRAVHRAETFVEPVGPMHEAALRKKRLNLKDEISSLLHA